ncbi:response regulator [Euzebya tangerina]|uniref:response regulator n=1 Tax=Euzebya tangerina TaxID=591198 RepID=UPI000E312B04|nr:response regulator transcription factor [Euzebya tangerina]
MSTPTDSSGVPGPQAESTDDHVRLIIVDDHAVVRTGLERLVDGWADIELVGTAADGQEAVDMVARLADSGRKPDVALMDLAMPVLDGVAATAQLKRDHPTLRVVVLTSLGERSQIAAAIDAGADGYLFKHAEPDEIAAAIRSVAGGDAVLDPKAARVLLDSRGPSSTPLAETQNPLSQREEQVIRLVHEGLANKQIARRLGIAERTVKTHLTNAFKRLGVEDRTQAALWAQTNLIDRSS